MNAYEEPSESVESDRKQKYFGKYRGTVVNTVDPDFRGRIKAIVPDVSRVIPTTWAMPCFPWAGLQSGCFIVPVVGSGVWIEYERGELDCPIWTGCWAGSAADGPVAAKALAPGAPAFMLESARKAGLVLSDVPVAPHLPAGGIVIKCGASFIRIDESGISMFGPTIRINGATIVDVNGGALTILGPASPG